MLLFFLVLIVIAWLLVQTTPVQNWIVGKVTSKLSRNLHTKVTIRHVNFSLFNKMLLEDALILDHQNDTLLYAGTARLNITDWFFFKDTVSLKYVGLDDAYLNINRKDSIWNYQFLTDYFFPHKKIKDSTRSMVPDLKVVEINRIKIVKKDAWAGQDQHLSLKGLSITLDNFNPDIRKLGFNKILIDHPVYSESNYKGSFPAKLIVRSSSPNDRLNPGDWLISVRQLQIKEGDFIIDNATNRDPYPNTFDGQHIHFSSINGTFNHILFSKDTITASVALAAKERSGFELQELHGDVKVTPQMVEFRNADLRTGHSQLKDYLALKFKDFNADMADFVHAVTLSCNFREAEISSKDLAFFSPGLKAWERGFNISGKVEGTIDNFSATGMLIHSDNTHLDGDIVMRGLPDIGQTYINFESRDLKSNYAELSNLVPSLKSITNPRLSALGNIRFRGNYAGTIYDFITSGIIETDLGNIATNINLKLPAHSSPVYTGKLSTHNFQLGKFIEGSGLGVISFDGKISGNGFTGKTLDMTMDGTIGQVEYNHYNFQNIVTKGNFRHKLFEGTLSIDDPNLKIDNLVGTINFNGDAPQFNFNAEVSKFYMKNLGLTENNFSLTGTFDMNFKGSNIDNFLGHVRIYNSVLRNNDQRLSFDSLTINSSIENGRKYLSVQTNELDASVSGTFTILDLPNAFTLFLNRYYPAYIRPPRHEVKNQEFTFDIKTNQLDQYLSLVSTKIKGFNNSEIAGNINLTANQLNLFARVPDFSYGSTHFSNVLFTGKGSFDSLNLSGQIEDVAINDSLHLPDTRILVTARNDISDVSIKTSASKTLNEADLSARILTMAEGFKLDFNPSSFVINDKKWILEKGGELILSKTILSASEVKFVQQNQELTISTEPSGITNSNDIIVNLKNLNMGDVLPFFVKDPKMDGLLTGNVRINDPFGNMTAEFDTREDAFRFENDSVGILTTRGNYDSKSGALNINTLSDNQLFNFLANLSIQLKDSTSNQLKGEVKLTHTAIHPLEKYISGTFSGLHGDASGKLIISGSGKSPKLTGTVSLDNVSLTLNYTRCRYIFEQNSILTFLTDKIDVGALKIRDTLKNTATVTGRLEHHFFTDFYFDQLHLKTDRRNGEPGKFVLLNTSAKDNKEFYGHLIGDADLSLNGPVSDMKMNISGQPTDSSHIYLPTGESAETGKINYIEFTKFGREMSADLANRSESNIKVDMQITANPYAQVDVILDEVTGDVIKAKGSGKLNISVGTKEPFSIRGRYDLLEGQYTFNFQTFLKTPFNLQQGYIEWQGDPYLANLNMDATYRASQVDMSSIPTSKGYTRSKGDIDIIFKLRGTLKDPKPDFEFLFTFNNPLRSDPIANEYLKTRFQDDKNELNKQVTSLLLFNGFMTDQQRLISTNNTVNFATRTLGQMLSTYLSSSLNNWLQKLLNTNAVNLYTNINASDFNFNSGTQQQIQNLGNFGFKTTFLKNRLLINFGGDVDYRLVQSSANTNSNFLFTPDVSFEYLISPDGKFRVVGFNRSDADIGDIAGLSRRNRTGLLLSYRKDFDTYAELFGRKK